MYKNFEQYQNKNQSMIIFLTVGYQNNIIFVLLIIEKIINIY